MPVLQENVLILDDDVTHTTDLPLHLANPFACANVLAGNILDDVTSMVSLLSLALLILTSTMLLLCT